MMSEMRVGHTRGTTKEQLYCNWWHSQTTLNGLNYMALDVHI